MTIITNEQDYAALPDRLRWHYMRTVLQATGLAEKRLSYQGDTSKKQANPEPYKKEIRAIYSLPQGNGFLIKWEIHYVKNYL